MDNAVRRHNDVIVYIWTGTCDITKLIKKEISVRRPNSHDTVDKIVIQYRRAISIVEPYGNHVILRFIDCPTYSPPSRWNTYKGLSNPTPLSVDKDVSEHVEYLNEQIDILNTELGNTSVRLNNDLLNCRRRLDRRTSLHDGIHPDKFLKQAWCVLLIKDFALQTFAPEILVDSDSDIDL